MPHLARQRIATTDPEEGHAALRAMYAEHHVRLPGPSDAFHFNADAMLLGTVNLATVQHSARAQVDAHAGLPSTTILQPRTTGLQLEHRHQILRLEASGVVLLTPGTACRAEWSAYDAVVTTLDDELLARDAAALTDDTPLHFDLARARSRSAAAHWARTTAFVRGTANALDHADTATPLALRNLTALLNSAALACFPNSTDDQSVDTPTGSRPAMPASLARAKAFIDSHLDAPIDLATIADAARVSPRALQAGFRRHLDTTPGHYLRLARLAQARDDLLTATPGTTVTHIATRWGWTNPGRFAKAYHHHYGHYPSDDLTPH